MATIKKILVPTDFSENSLSVFSFVRETAKNYGASVDLVYILPEASPFFEVTRDPLGNIFKDRGQYGKIRSEFIEKLENIMTEQIESAHRGRVFILHDDKPSVALSDFAKQEDYDLIMIASRGWGNSMFKRGSVTEKLIRISSTPVVSVNKGYDPDIQRILIPTDGSQNSFEVLPLALKIAHKNEAKIDLLNIYVYESFAARTIGGDTGKYSLDEMKEFILNNLVEFVNNNSDKLEFVGEPKIDEDLKIKNDEGHIVEVSLQAAKAFSSQEAIIEYALAHNQLVIIATRGRGAISNFFIGSTTEKVARHLRMPVITVKPDVES